MAKNLDEVREDYLDKLAKAANLTRDEAKKQLSRLQKTAWERNNTFEALMEAAKCCSLGSMSHALYEVGGEYRRNM